MGLFDTVLVDYNCPYCGVKLDHFQTKALENLMYSYRLGDQVKTDKIVIKNGTFELHTFCDKCENTIDGKAVVKNNKISAVYQANKFGKEVLVAKLWKRKVSKKK